MRVAYEDVRFQPRSPLATELLSRSLEEELAKPMESVQNNRRDADPNIADATPIPDSPRPPTPSTPHVQFSLLATASDGAVPQMTVLTNRTDCRIVTRGLRQGVLTVAAITWVVEQVR